MKRPWVSTASLLVSVVSLACWIVMFLAATDVWHDTGRPDLWNLKTPPYNDLRVFVVAFYVLAAALAAQLLVACLALVWRPRQRA